MHLDNSANEQIKCKKDTTQKNLLHFWTKRRYGTLTDTQMIQNHIGFIPNEYYCQTLAKDDEEMNNSSLTLATISEKSTQLKVTMGQMNRKLKSYQK